MAPDACGLREATLDVRSRGCVLEANLAAETCVTLQGVRNGI